MGNELLASKTITQEEAPSVVVIPTISTSITAFVGVTQRGPFAPTVVTSFAEYQKIFGTFTTTSDLPQCVQSFFDNGGSQAVIVRVVHYTTPGTPASKTSAQLSIDIPSAAPLDIGYAQVPSSDGPTWSTQTGRTLVISLDNGATTIGTATFTGTKAKVTSTNAATFNIPDGATLNLTLNGHPLVVTFHSVNFVDNTAATAAEVIAVINALINAYALMSNTDSSGNTPGDGHLSITSNFGGTQAGVTVTGGTARTILGFSTTPSVGTGNVGNITAVTFTEVTNIVQGACPGVKVQANGGSSFILRTTATGSSTQILVRGSSTAAADFGLDTANHMGAPVPANVLNVKSKTDYDPSDVFPGLNSDNLPLAFLPSTSGQADEFNFLVVREGAIVESFPNLSMDPASPRYVINIVNDPENGSDYFTLSDYGYLTADTNLTATDVMPSTEGGDLTPVTNGDGGLTGIVDADYLGAANSSGPLGTGLRMLDATTVNILTIPGRATSAVHNGMLTYCEVTRGGDCFAVLDPPASQSIAGIRTYVRSTASLKGFSEFGAIYYPRVKVLNPNTDLFGNTSMIVIPPSGAVAGCYAFNDSAQEGGVYQPPAGIERGILRNVLGLETTEVNDQNKRDLIYPDLINPITALDGEPICIDGVKTLKETGNFPTIAERRGAIFIEQSIKAGLRFARHSNNDGTLRARCERTAYDFLLDQMDLSAFATKVPKTAFFVDFDIPGKTLNNPAVVRSKRLRGRIGIATQSPAEWVIILFSQFVSG